MTWRRGGIARVAAVMLAALATAPVWAHSASDAYLTLEAQPGNGTVLRGQWDIALRDLNFVLKLDDDGDGNITWGELRRHQAAIAKYAYTRLRLASGGKPCAIRPARQLVDNHADGAYAALFFDVVCSAGGEPIALDYRLFFAIDPSHRGILVMRSGHSVATSLLSPENARVELQPRPSR